jgi:hypothetical protein
MSRRRREERKVVGPGVILGGAAIAGVILGVALQQSGASLPDALSFATPADQPNLDLHYVPPAIAPLEDTQLPALEGLPAYPGSRPAPLASDVRTQAMPTAIAWFSTPDSVDDVLDWYENTLNEGGIAAFAHRFGPSTGYVAYHRRATDAMHVVAVMRQGSETLVFPALTQAGNLAQARAEVPAGIPHPGAALHTSVVDVIDGGVKMTTVTGIVELASLAELVAFYQRELAARGWQVDLVAQGIAGQARIEARRAGARFEVMLNNLAAGNEVSAVQIVAMQSTQN